MLFAKSSVGPAGVRAVDQALAVQEPERELLVVARRSHRDHERDPIDPDLERLLDRDLVVAAVVVDLREREGAHVSSAGQKFESITASPAW